MPTPTITVTDNNEIVLDHLCLINLEDVEDAIDDLDEDQKHAYAALTDDGRSKLMRDIAERLNVAVITDAIYDYLGDTFNAAIARTLNTTDRNRIHQVSISEFARQFSDDYEILYEQKPCPTPRTPLTQSDLNRGNQLIRDQHPLVAALATYRQDILSSDREVIAFVRAMRALDVLYVDPLQLRIVS